MRGQDLVEVGGDLRQHRQEWDEELRADLRQGLGASPAGQSRHRGQIAEEERARRTAARRRRRPPRRSPRGRSLRRPPFASRRRRSAPESHARPPRRARPGQPDCSSRSRRAPGPATSATAPKAAATSAMVRGGDERTGGAAGSPRTLNTRRSEAGNARPVRKATAFSISAGSRPRRNSARRRRFSRRPRLSAKRRHSDTSSANGVTRPLSGSASASGRDPQRDESPGSKTAESQERPSAFLHCGADSPHLLSILGQKKGPSASRSLGEADSTTPGP